MNPTEATIRNPEFKVWESEGWVAMLDRYPIVEGHTLLMPKREVAHVTELNDDEAASMGAAIKTVSGMLKGAYGEGLLVSMKCGEGSARTISHLHVHLIPRKSGDRLWDAGKSRIVLDRTSGFPRLDVSGDELKETLKKIRGE